MANWKVNVDVSDLFYPDDPKHSTKIKDDQKYFKEVRDKMLERLSQSDDQIKCAVRAHEYEVYKELKHFLSKCKTLDKFNDYWSYLYDWADDNLIWINIFPAFKKEETCGRKAS